MSDTKFTPHVFISAASDDLRSAREIVKNALLTEGCYPVVQEHFEPDFRTVKDMLRNRLKGCHAVVHLVGNRYGGEPSPDSLPPGMERRSWTQMEFDLARELGLKTFLFIFDDNYPFDQQPDPEPADEVELQQAHRQKILNGEQLYIEVKDEDELALRISEMKLEAEELRKTVEEGKRKLIAVIGGVLMVLVVIALLLMLIKKDTGDLEEGQETILSSIEEMRTSFSSLSSGGATISAPGSPEEFYHNARIFELNGDYGKARAAYLEFFKFGLEVLDPHLRFQKFLKVQDGLEGARDTYHSVVEQSDGVVPRLAAALLWPREKRIAELDRFLRSHPEVGPAHYLLSRDFSSRALGSQSLEDKRKEKQLLTEFQRLDEAGKVVPWFLDQGEVAEWRSDSSFRLAALEVSDNAMEEPVTVTWSNHNGGWTGSLQIAELANEIFVKMPGSDGFESTGMSAARSVTTGKPLPIPRIQLPKSAEKSNLEVKYTNLNGEEMGPFTVSFDPMPETLRNAKALLNQIRTSWVSFRDYDGKTLLYFTSLMVHRGGLEKITYGVDTEKPDRDFPFLAWDEPGMSPIDSGVTVYLEIPGNTKFVSVQLTFKDGSQSAIETFQRPR